MINAHTVHVHSPKGGTGCSTVAAALAIIAGETGATVHLADLSPAADLAAVLGIPKPAPGRVTSVSPRLELATGWPDLPDADTWPAHIIDWGTRPIPTDLPGHRLVVLTNSYLTLSAYVSRRDATPATDQVEPMHLVAVVDTDRPLNVRDIEHTTRLTALATWYRSPAIARATDAGLLVFTNPDLYKDLRPAAPIIPVEAQS